jgi:hypothetical protein
MTQKLEGFDEKAALDRGLIESPDPMWSEQSRFVEGARWQFERDQKVIEAKDQRIAELEKDLSERDFVIKSHVSNAKKLELEIESLLEWKDRALRVIKFYALVGYSNYCIESGDRARAFLEGEKS